MRMITLAAIFAAATLQTASAAELNVFVPPLMFYGGVPDIAKAYTAKTGVKVNVTLHPMGRSLNDIEKGPVAPDVIFLLTDYMGTLNLDKGIRPGTTYTPFARVYMGLAVRTGSPIPDISTREKLIAAMKASKGITYSDPSPARGSVEANMVNDLVNRPEIQAKGLHADTVDGKVAPNGPAYLLLGNGDMTMQPMNEMGDAGLTVVGPLPMEMHSFIDSSVAIAARAANPIDAAAFIKFAYSPEGQKLLTKGTIPFNQ